MLDASVSHEHECVSVHALLNILMFSRVSLLASHSHPHASGGPPPALLNPVMASAWCGCGHGLKGELEPSRLHLPQSRGVRAQRSSHGASCSWQACESQGSEIRQPATDQQDIFPRLLGSLAIWEYCWVNKFPVPLVPRESDFRLPDVVPLQSPFSHVPDSLLFSLTQSLPL